MHGSITDTSIAWPGWEKIARVLTLQDHATIVVVLGTMLLGLAAGVIGTYMVLRKRALIGDALSHSTLPGIAIAFIVMVQFGGTGKYLPGLLLGATITGLLGVLIILGIKGLSRVKEDAALGIVLSVFFGLGIALLGVIQKMPDGGQAGLESFIYGMTASMLTSDATLIGVTALIVIVLCALLYKEFAILSFDPAYAASQGWPTVVLDVLMMLLVTGVTVVGLQAVGLILVIAMLIIPAAAARFWTDHLPAMLLTAGLVGASSGYLGAVLSALVPKLPTGAIIVVVAAAIFGISMLFGARRGTVVRYLESRRLRLRVASQHLLRAMFEWLEAHRAVAAPATRPIPRSALLAARSWSPAQLARAIRRERRAGLVTIDGGDRRGALTLTADGLDAASRVTRNHRLWELYLINHADIAPSHVDRDADQIEHVLGPAMVRELESLLEAERQAERQAERLAPGVPESPHVLTPRSTPEVGEA